MSRKVFVFTVAAVLLSSLGVAHAAGFRLLYSFNGPDGAFPTSAPIFDSSGTLYATTSLGGSCPAFDDGCGTVFKIAPDGTQTVIYAFQGGAMDGDGPLGKLVRDANGNFFGVTRNGGGNGCDLGRGCGSVFKLTSGGAEKVLHIFPGGADGSNPTDLAADGLGTLYGTTTYGGSHDLGTVFRVSPNGKFKVLYSFAGGKDGANPVGSLIVDKQGNLYGTTQFGGDNTCSSGCGTVFQLTPDGKEKILYAFRGAADGYQPMAGLLASRDGAFYGTTFFGGGDNDCGTVFRLTDAGEESVLHAFTADDGCFPVASLIEDKNGNLYGTTMHGGPSFLGTVFRLTPDGQHTVLYDFLGEDDGCVPQGAVTRHKGRLYGTSLTCGRAFDGTVFRVRS